MKQLVFDDNMNISEEEPVQHNYIQQEYQPSLMYPCGNCLCDSCIYNVENSRVRLGDISPKLMQGYQGCFNCDNCSIYGGDTKKKCLRIKICEKYCIDKYHAEAKRKKFKVIK